MRKHRKALAPPPPPPDSIQDDTFAAVAPFPPPAPPRAEEPRNLCGAPRQVPDYFSWLVPPRAPDGPPVKPEPGQHLDGHASLPREMLRLRHVYGYRGSDTHGNLAVCPRPDRLARARPVVLVSGLQALAAEAHANAKTSSLPSNPLSPSHGRAGRYGRARGCECAA